MQIKLFLLARKLSETFFPKDVSDFFLKSICETVEYRHKNIQCTDNMDLLIKKKDGGQISLSKLAVQFNFSLVNLQLVISDLIISF